ncbi:MAG: hypothetical protein ACM3X1_04650 [Ignavibacteriales bacterium]
MPRDIGKETLEEKPYDIDSHKIHFFKNGRIQENEPQISDSDMLFSRSWYSRI